jgi:two-component system, LytTR family, response regulator
VIRALIVEDELPARVKLRQWLASEPDVEVVGDVGDGDAALNAITSASPHVVFLDIQIPGLNGLGVAARLAGGRPLVVFVTAHGEHALAAFDSNAVDYLLKPYDRERFARTLERVRRRLGNGATAPEKLIVPIGDRLRFVTCDEIAHIESEGNYVRIHTQSCNYLLRRTLQDLLSELGLARFARIHRSRAVNRAWIVSLKPLVHGDVEVELKTGVRLRMSRRYRAELPDMAI